jgi:hypothetical protein
VLGELAVLDADDVSDNPGRGAAVAGEARPWAMTKSPSATISWFS